MPEGESDPGRGLKAHAGPDGRVRFHIRPSWECEEVAKLVVESVKNGKTSHHPLHVRSSHSPSKEMPAPPVEGALANRQIGKARPPLPLDEALRLTDEETLARGYGNRGHGTGDRGVLGCDKAISLYGYLGESPLYPSTGNDGSN